WACSPRTQTWTTRPKFWGRLRLMRGLYCLFEDETGLGFLSALRLQLGNHSQHTGTKMRLIFDEARSLKRIGDNPCSCLSFRQRLEQALQPKLRTGTHDARQARRYLHSLRHP